MPLNKMFLFVVLAICMLGCESEEMRKEICRLKEQLAGQEKILYKQREEKARLKEAQKLQETAIRNYSFLLHDIGMALANLSGQEVEFKNLEENAAEEEMSDILDQQLQRIEENVANLKQRAADIESLNVEDSPELESLRETVKKLQHRIDVQVEHNKKLIGELNEARDLNYEQERQLVRIQEALDDMKSKQMTCYVLATSKDKIKQMRSLGYLSGGKLRGGYVNVTFKTKRDPASAGFKVCDCWDSEIPIGSNLSGLSRNDVRSVHRDSFNQMTFDRYQLRVSNPKAFWSAGSFLILRTD